METKDKDWKAGYAEGLEKALTMVEIRGRFGLEKVIKELQDEIDKLEAKIEENKNQ